jgi:hypothetical protein
MAKAELLKAARATLCVCAVAGCASSESMLLTEDTALISAHGRTLDDKAMVIDATLAEAARMTRSHGYRYFVIVSAADASRVERMTVPRLRHEDTNHREDLYTAASRSPSAYALSVVIPPRRKLAYVKPGLDITIRMYRDGEVNPNTSGVWNSDMILRGATPSR